MKVSVIIPTYNREEFIGEAVYSVLNQTYDDLEVIVVDDGSTDATSEVMEMISDPRLQYIRQDNRGRSAARNHALSMAQGTYITFLDSDDLYLPDKVELQVDYLNQHPDTGMVYTSAYCINEEGEPLEHEYKATASGAIYEHIAFFTPVTITLPTVMARSEVFKAVGGFDENMSRFEDTDMWRRISKYCRIDAMQEYTCKLRTHEDNSLLSQCSDQIVTALDYYATKIINEDNEIDLLLRNKGIAGMYRYYGHALSTVPKFSDAGQKLMRVAETYYFAESDGYPVHGSLFSRFARFVYGKAPGALQWLARFVYYRSLNSLYLVYSKIKRIIKS